MRIRSLVTKQYKVVFALLLIAVPLYSVIFVVKFGYTTQHALPSQGPVELTPHIPLPPASKLWPLSMRKRLSVAVGDIRLAPSLASQEGSVLSLNNSNDIPANPHGSRKSRRLSFRESSASLKDKVPFTQASSSSIPPARPLAAVDPKVWKFEPPTSVLATRPRGTMHPDSLNPKRTYNTEPPNLPQCHSEGDKVVSIYLESYNRLINFFGRQHFSSRVTECSMPNEAQCKLVSNDKLADAVFRFVFYTDPRQPLRYCKDQTLIVFNSERLRYTNQMYQQLDLADIRIDHFLTSDAYFLSVCNHHVFDLSFEVQPQFDPKKRSKGVAMFLSNCKYEWRYNYVKLLMKYIDIDSYGECLHNVPQQASRQSKGRNSIVTTSLRSYRMMLTFENTIQENYITEKIWVAYSGGAIPVYLGPPDVYDWVPGNHTFIDPRDFAGPKELAEYMKRVAEDDDLYRYHTSNFDWDRTKRMMDKYCGKRSDFVCSMCELAYKRKLTLTR